MTAPRAEGTALERAMEALERLRDYFDQRADADAVGDPMRYQGNVEMHRLRDCDELLAALRSRDADIAAAVSAENEAFYDMVQREDSRSLAGVSAHDPLRRLMDAIRARREGGSDATGE